TDRSALIEQNRAVVQRYFDTVSSGTRETVVAAITECFDPDVKWQLPASLPNGGLYEGRDAAIAMIVHPKGLSNFELGSMRHELDEFICDESHVVVPFRLTARTARGEDYENQYVMIFTLRDGKVVHVMNLCDTLYLSQKFYGD